MRLKGPNRVGHFRRWMQLDLCTVAIPHSPFAFLLPVTVLLLVLIQSGCAGYTSTDAAPSIVTQPANQTVTAGQTAIFSVSASGTAPLSYQWNKNGMAISGATLSSYTTPAETTSGSGSRFTVMVSNSAGSATSSAAMLTVTATGAPPSITTQPTSQTVTAGQTATFSVVASGTAPLSYQWQMNGATIGGATSSSYTTPAETTSNSGARFTAVVRNSGGSSTSNTAILSVDAAPPSTPSQTGPALPTLPQATVDLTMPTQTGTVWNVPAGDAATLQKDINAATCGDTIVLVAGSTYSGNFTIPSTSCSGWIEIVSSALVSLPSPGNRVSPSNVSNMATVSTPNAVPVFAFLPSSNHWRLMGLHITTSETGANEVYNLMIAGFLADDYTSVSVISQLPNQIILDRVYIFGTTDGVTLKVDRGINANTQSFAMVDSYCDGIVDTGQDSQCIASTNGTGPFLIQNNFLQAAGENIMFGGSDPAITNLIPSDITVIGNLFQKNLSWEGAISDVKNLFEIKNAQRVLLDGNVLQYTWVGGQQEAIILRAVNQSLGCAWCSALDITVTHNIISHAPQAFAIAPVEDPEHPAVPTGRVLVQNNLMTDISCTAWGSGRGLLFQLTAEVSPYIMHDIVINHNTGFGDPTACGDSGWIYIGSDNDAGFIRNLQTTNNISNYGYIALAGDGCGPGTCALSAYAPGYVYNDNVWINSTGLPDGHTWPFGTYWSVLSGVGFTSYSGTNPNLTGNFQLTSGSAYHNAGTDGEDIGVWDWTCLNNDSAAALAGKFVPGPGGCALSGNLSPQ